MKIIKTKKYSQLEQNNKGKYENDYYVIGGSDTTDSFGNKGVTYWITWLDTGSKTSGYSSAAEARNSADGIVEKMLNRENSNNMSDYPSDTPMAEQYDGDSFDNEGF